MPPSSDTASHTSNGLQAAPAQAAEIVLSLLGVPTIAFIVCLLTTPLLIRLALRHNLVDAPDQARKAHHRPVACLGGLALLLGWLAGMLSSGILTSSAPEFGLTGPSIRALTGIVLGAGIILLTGLIDDLRVLRPRYKLLGQILAALALAAHGVGFAACEGLLNGLGEATGIAFFTEMPAPLIAAIAAVLTTFLIVGGSNAMNLLDGADGLAAGITTVAMLGFSFVAVSLAAGIDAEHGNHAAFGGLILGLILGMALLGALLGFLPYNARPARIFMGDAGSMFLGFLCVTLILLLGGTRNPLPMFAGLAIFALPVLDTALAVLRRKRRGLSIACPDTYHLHHLLLRAGFGVSHSVKLLCVLAAGFAAAGCAMLYYPLGYTLPAFGGLFALTALAAHQAAERAYRSDHAESGAHPTLRIRPTAASRAAPPPAALRPNFGRFGAVEAEASAPSEAIGEGSSQPKHDDASDTGRAA